MGDDELEIEKTQLDITVKSAFQLIDKTANLILSKIAILIFSQFCWVFLRWNVWYMLESKQSFADKCLCGLSESETYPELQIRRFGPRIPCSNLLPALVFLLYSAADFTVFLLV